MISPEQSQALTMVFASIQDGDSMRIEFALRNLETCIAVQGLERKPLARAVGSTTDVEESAG